jgi:hypothetical protein
MKQSIFILIMMLSLTSQAQQMNVTLTTGDKVKSGQPLKLTIALTDDKGKAIGGTVSVCVTDTVLIKNAQKNSSQGYKELLAKSTDLMEVLHTMKPFTVTNDQIIFAGSQSSLSDPLGALIVIDGQQMGDRASVINGIVPQSVVEIKMSKDLMDIQKYTSSNVSGIIEITTIKTKPKTVIPAEPVEDAQAPHQPLYRKDAIEVESSGQLTLEIPALKETTGLKITVNASGTNGQSGSATKIIKVTGGKR